MVMVQKMDPLDMVDMVQQRIGLDGGGCSAQVICDSIGMTYAALNQHSNVLCSVSGGADSDIMMDIVWRLDYSNKVRYCWYNTGLEYQATKDHLKFLGDKYGVHIDQIYAKKSVPLSCKEYGLPFMSKLISENLERMQSHGFDWSLSCSYEEHITKFPDLISCINWWHNKRNADFEKFKTSMFNINHTPFLKEFISAYPPPFPISAKCCKYAKKDVAKSYCSENEITLDIVGVRRAEGGTRVQIKTCYHDQSKPAKFFPLLWYKNIDKVHYEKLFNVTHSACYTVYGLKRTGCVGCPFGASHNDELLLLLRNEPKLYKAAIATFGPSYEYTNAYVEFRNKEKERHVWLYLKDYNREFACDAPIPNIKV